MKFREWLKPLASLVAIAALGGGAVLVNQASQADAADSVTVNAGGGAAGVSVELFRPSNVRLAVGGTLTVVNDYEEPHTLSFVLDPADIPAGVEGLTAPFGSSEGFNGSQSFSTGLIEKGGSASLTFGQQGSYHFLCLIHPGMALDVTVGGANEPTVVSPGASAFLTAGIDLGEAAAAAQTVPPATENTDGSKTWNVLTGPSVPYQASTVDVMRFNAPEIEVNVGDTVTWTNTTGVPHTVTFLPGPPPEDFNPFETTQPSEDFDPSQVYSGLISAAPEFGGQQNFSLTFTKPGTYTYICVLHIDQGMAGVITVTGSGTSTGTVTPPNTGDAGLIGPSPDSSPGEWTMYAGLALLAVGLFTAGGVATIRRR